MKRILAMAIAVIILVMLLLSVSCTGLYEVELSDNLRSSVIVTYGTPYYYNAVLSHYYYPGHYYYPYGRGFYHRHRSIPHYRIW